MTLMTLDNETHSARTRASLLEGIQAGDEARWQEFCRVYSPVIRGFALKAGLTETEADEVVQETCIGVARNVGEFHYDPKKCRFKTWLLNLAAWRIKNQFAKRQRWDDRVHGTTSRHIGPGDRALERSCADDARTATIERLADVGQENLDFLWDQEGHENILRLAIERVRTRFNATQFQIFDLTVTKEWAPAEVAKSLGVSLTMVYLTKHRVSSRLKKEVALLRMKAEQAGW